MPAEQPKVGYRAVADELAVKIDTGLIRPGEQLPSRREICERWGVSDPTAARVYNDLQKRGYASLSKGHRPIAVNPALEPVVLVPVLVQLPAATISAVAGFVARVGGSFDEAVDELLHRGLGA